MSQTTKLTRSGSVWVGSHTLTVSGRMYQIRVQAGSDGLPTATLTALTGPTVGTVYPLARDCCGCAFAVFVTGDPAVCTGTDACGGPCANQLKIEVAWSQCAYSGPGWYCVRRCVAAGGSAANPAYVVELVEGDESDTDIVIVSGPYSTESAALAACAPVCDPPHTFGSPDCVVSGQTGGCVSAIPGPLTSVGPDGGEGIIWAWSGTGGFSIALRCDTGTYNLSLTGAGCPITSTLLSATESPFELVFQVTWGSPCANPCVGSATFTITDP